MASRRCTEFGAVTSNPQPRLLRLGNRRSTKFSVGPRATPYDGRPRSLITRVSFSRSNGAAGYAASLTIGSAIRRPRLDRPPPRRSHVSLERRSAEHHDAGLPTGQVAAFERDRAGVGVVRLDGGKPHRGRARNAQNRAVLIEHRGSPLSPSPPGNRSPKRPRRLSKVAHSAKLSPLITGASEMDAPWGYGEPGRARPGSNVRASSVR